VSVQSDIGPNGTPRWKVYQQARELVALADLALACAAQGPRQDLPRALAQFDRMRAILGDRQVED
jgi:hypothetical protein